MKKPDETKGIFNKLPVSASEFIQLVIKKMRYRREVRQDVQAELTAHFEDELKDCKRDSEREQKARQLIANFGDARLLAVLLRRAKKRCRPLWRTAVARTFQTTGIIILCFIVYVVWFFTGKPVITTDYVAELNRINRPVTDETLNAAPLYNKAAERYSELPEDISVLFRKKYWEFTTEQKQLMEKWLTDNQETLELVIAGTQRPYYCRTYGNKQNTSEMISVILPNLRDFRNLARDLACRAWFRAEQGRYKDAFNDVKSCYRFGRHLKGDKFFIEQLVAFSVEKMATQTLRDILSEHRINAAILAKLQNDYEKMIADENFVIGLAAEKMSLYDEIQRCFTADGPGGGHLYIKRVRQIAEPFDWDRADSWLAANFVRVLFTHPNKQQTLTAATKFYGYIQEATLKTPARIRTEQIDIDQELQRLTSSNVLFSIFLPAFERIIEYSYQNKADVQGTLSIIAMLRYKQDTGGYPENLEQLIADAYLKELAMDPYTDEQLVYRRTADNFILYSFGRNFKDDGGKSEIDRKGRPRMWDDDGDRVFWPVPKYEAQDNDVPPKDEQAQPHRNLIVN
ncbi:MAG: hypothetical protein WBC22_17385 [Sedimentisphaerales bacterium]